MLPADAGRYSDAEDDIDGPAAPAPAAAAAASGDDGGASDGWYDDDDQWADGVDDGERLTVANSESLASRFDSLISLQPLRGTSMSQAAGNSLSRTERKAAQPKHTGLTRDERATTEHVLDPRTRLLLFKMLNSGVLQSINGCVSTGKEANVYHAFAREPAEVAVKVYKTSVLTFKDRDRYVAGEFRWRHGYCRSNPRKMVRMWAEKEMRNYRRLAEAGVPCPAPLALREHVLLMSFVGCDGYAAPRLKDASLSADEAASASRQVMLLLRHIFHGCRLVHADFSEYNLLWYNGRVVVIDVSQAVEHDHPNALVFLRKDCENAILFFRRQGVRPLPTLQQLFGFVTDPVIGRGEEEAAYDALLAAGAPHGEQEAGPEAGLEAGLEAGPEAGLEGLPLTQDEAEAAEAGAAASAAASAEAAAEEEVSERVFAQMHIPRTLGELPLMQIERDIRAARGGQGGSLAYARLNGFNEDLSIATAQGGEGAGAARGEGAAEGGEAGSGAGSGSESESEGEGESDEEEGEEGERLRRPRAARLHHFEDRDDKRERKAAAKEAKREARLNKTPKHVKKAKKKGVKR